MDNYATTMTSHDQMKPSSILEDNCMLPNFGSPATGGHGRLDDLSSDGSDLESFFRDYCNNTTDDETGATGEPGMAKARKLQIEKQLLEKLPLQELQAGRKFFQAFKKSIKHKLTSAEVDQLKNLRRKVLSRGYAARTKRRQKSKMAELEEEVVDLNVEVASLRAQLAAAHAAGGAVVVDGV